MKRALSFTPLQMENSRDFGKVPDLTFLIQGKKLRGLPLDK